MSSLSLDVSASKTGWCYTNDGKKFIMGTITTKPKYTRSERLIMFNTQLFRILKKYKPVNIVIEDTFAGINVKTLKILSEFAGVAKFTCKKVSGIEPFVVENTKVKSYFKTRTKELLFYLVCDVFNKKELTFKKDNDIIDALAQLMYYTDVELNLYSYREDKVYGFLYRSRHSG